ncbi:MAG: transglycosylase domain-containing protein [Bacillota bacterium]
MAKSRKENAKERKPGGRRVSVLDMILYLLIVCFLVGGGAVAYVVATAVKDLPVITDLDVEVDETSFVYDGEGKVWTQLHATENRIPVKLEELPKHVVDAVLAAEDHRFFSHWGVDLRAIFRALWSNLKSGDSTGQGGSTITQQLAKKQFLTDSRTWTRKIQDALMAIRYEREFTKEEILEKYLNQIPFGRGAYGIGAASAAFFDKSPAELTVDEAAFLAGMIKGPYLYDPADNPEGGLNRRNTVLMQMAEYGFLAREEAETLKAKPLATIEPRTGVVAEGAYFLDYVLKQLLAKYPSELVYGGGLRIYTTYSPEAQRAVDSAIASSLDTDFPYENADSMQAAAVVMDVKTGNVLAMVGGRKHEEMLAWNRAVDTKRQPGSAFKPLSVYIPALESGILPNLVVNDSPITFTDPITGEKWSPTNYDGSFSGLVTMREAVRRSLNVVAAKIQDMIGTKLSLETAEKMGITSLVKEYTSAGLNDYTRSISLGGLTHGVSALDMAVAFGTIANRGIKVEPITILRVEDKNGNVLMENKTKRQLVISEETAFMMTSMLKDVLGPGGTGAAANIGRPAAGKTGTTSDWKDAWFCGFTPNTVGVVWMGFDQNKTMERWRITGGSYPALIWGKMMRQITAGERAEFPMPATMTTVQICKKTGELPSPACPASDVVTEFLPKGKEPSTLCTFPHGWVGETPIAPESDPAAAAAAGGR